MKKQIPQYLVFRCGMAYLYYLVKKLSRNFILPKELLKTEMNHDEIDENNWRDRKDEGLP